MGEEEIYRARPLAVRLLHSLVHLVTYRAHVPASWIGAACGVKYLLGL